jgi:hypothetical protein
MRGGRARPAVVLSGGVTACLAAVLTMSGRPVLAASPAPARRTASAASDKAPAPAAAPERVASPAPPVASEQAAPAQPAARPPAAGGAPDLEKLRSEYDRLREELFKARVRSQKASETVWPSKIDVRLRWKGGPDFVIGKARMLLDGAELWDSADAAQTDDVIQVAERSVKPGPHAFTVRLEIRPKTEVKGGAKVGADKLGYTAEHTFAIVVAESGVTHLELTGDEDGNPPEYEPELELELETDK